MTDFQSLGLTYCDGVLRILDQTLLPEREEWVIVQDPEHMTRLIQNLSVRGAPLIGVAAAFALANYAMTTDDAAQIKFAAKSLRAARPTAVNLMWAIDRMLAEPKLDGGNLMRVAQTIAQEDVRMCEAMASHAFDLIEDGSQVLTVCNSGGLATVGLGTALGAAYYGPCVAGRFHVLPHSNLGEISALVPSDLLGVAAPT